MFLRVAAPADAMAVARVHVRSWQAAYRGLLFDEYLDALQPEEWAQRYSFADADAGKPLTVLALEGSDICGLATIGPSADGDKHAVGELLALYVDPDRRGLGVGRALVQEARARLARQGFAEACLWVLAGNEWAERFYRLDGWSPDGSRRSAKVPGFSVEDIRYRRSLP
ncbi:MAG TPA: GNAT family N-acetyltransferase [Solirubrobacteraceae bacterium]|jgi:GNAT superfamily N-acetyltransferase|nr:GNAT family N-acetyltransferase [Solirubrobacteraceae bacterium]